MQPADFLKIPFRKFMPHITAVILFVIISITYFHPLLEGKELLQPDITQFRGMAREIYEHREETGEEALWTNAMFSGMPAYLISIRYPFNLVRYADRLLSLGIPRPAKYLFLSLAGFYILMLAFRVDPWLAIAGALAFGFSTYFFIIEAAGHNTKAHAMSYMAPILAGVVLAFKGKVRLGAVLLGLFLALQIFTNHLQITYYTMLIVIVYGIYELVHAIRQKTVQQFFRTLMILTIPVLLAVASNFTNLYLVWEYGQYSMRGPAELTSRQEVRTGGLDRDYILDDYSYGIAETMNLMIPNFKGGASSYDLGTGSELYEVLTEHGVQGAREIVSSAPVYWGGQRFTAGPVYIGAAVIFFFVLGMFSVRGRYKWWLITATVLAIMLAWGKNFAWLSDLFIYYFPGYNRFRTVSMILVIAQITIPMLAVLGLRQVVLEGRGTDIIRALKKAFYITGGISLVFFLFPGAFLSFTGDIDHQLIAAGWPDMLIDALERDRMRLLRMDALRSFIYIFLSAGVVWLFLQKKMPAKYMAMAVAAVILADLWGVGRRFLDSDDFVTPREISQPFLPTEADVVILRDDDPHYRVYNTTRSPFNEAITSYHHNSIGGYHGAKMGRYQDLIDYHLGRNNMDVLNMLNAKYFIRPGEEGRPQPFRNPGALGNAWFVDSVRIVESADEEILALNDFDPASEAVVDRRFYEHVSFLSGTGNPPEDMLQADQQTATDVNDGMAGSDASEIEPVTAEDTAGENGEDGTDDENGDHITLVSYSPNHLVYEAKTGSDRIAVFSEVYYDAGWEAFINGNPAEHFRVNYILRAMEVPRGEHEIEFRFRPRGYFTGEWISLAGSLLLILLTGGVLWKEVQNLREPDFADTAGEKDNTGVPGKK